MPRVMIVDDHAAIRRGVEGILHSFPEWELCGEADNGQRPRMPAARDRDPAPDFEDAIAAVREGETDLAIIPVRTRSMAASPTSIISCGSRPLYRGRRISIACAINCWA